jgi:hypothetical protein
MVRVIYLQFLLERFDLHWSQNSPVVGLWCARLVVFGGPISAILAEMPGVFALSTSITCGLASESPVPKEVQPGFHTANKTKLNSYSDVSLKSYCLSE